MANDTMANELANEPISVRHAILLLVAFWIGLLLVATVAIRPSGSCSGMEPRGRRDRRHGERVDPRAADAAARLLATGEGKDLTRIVALTVLSLGGAIVTMLRPHTQIFIG